MSGSRILVDTNILLYFLKGDSEIVSILSDKKIVVSFITELELLSFPKIVLNDEEIIKGLLKNCEIIELNQNLKDLTINFRRKYKLKLPDAIVAATSYITNLPLLTADKHFNNIEELGVIIYEL